MEYEEIKCLKQSEKSAVYLVREKGGEKLFIRKILNGKHMPYQTLQDYQHPCLPKLYEVTVSEESTVVVEEYIEGQSCGAVDFSEKQFRKIVGELCSVLEFLHGNGIIHRDIKPSNIIFTEKGHVLSTLMRRACPGRGWSRIRNCWEPKGMHRRNSMVFPRPMSGPIFTLWEERWTSSQRENAGNPIIKV